MAPHLPNLEYYFPEYATKGAIFSHMPQAPWAAVEGVGLSLDVAYIGVHSGQKTASRFVRQNILNNEANAEYIAAVLWTMYGNSWERLWNAAESQYQIFDSYSMKEVFEMLGDDKRIINRNVTDKSTSEDSTQANTSNTGSSSSDSSVYSFNSQTAVPTQSNSGSSTDTSTETSTVNSTNDSTSDELTTDDLNKTQNSTRTRTGNLGNVTYQDLIRQEFELWRFHLYERLFEDADKFLVLHIYDGCL